LIRLHPRLDALAVFGEELACTPQARRDRACRDRHQLGDLAHRHLLELEEGEYAAELERHGAQDVVEQGTRPRTIEQIVRPIRRVDALGRCVVADHLAPARVRPP
jgi:hypothetical protein